MRKLTLATILTVTIMTTASANFSFMGDMIRDMTDVAREMKDNTIDTAREIKDNGIDSVKDIKDNISDDINDSKEKKEELKK